MCAVNAQPGRLPEAARLGLNHAFALLAVVEVVPEAVLIAGAIAVGVKVGACVFTEALAFTVWDTLQVADTACYAFTAGLAKKDVDRADGRLGAGGLGQA